MTPLLIGINGFKESGKSTIADYLCEKHGFEQRAYADKLKEAVCALLDISPKQLDILKNSDKYVGIFSQSGFNLGGWNPHHYMVPISIRKLLQRFGTEMGREVFGEDFLIDQLFKNEHPWPNKPLCISDARFENELERIIDLGGYNLRVHRSENKSDGHASEVSASDHLIHVHIQNDGSLNDLYNSVEWVINEFLERKESKR